MAMSLADLLTKEGFNRRLSKTTTRVSRGTSGPIYPLHKHVASTDRSKSDITWDDLRSNAPMSGNSADRRTKKESQHRTGTCDPSGVKRISITSFDELLYADASQCNEIGEANNSKYNRVYSNKTYRSESGGGMSSSASEEAQGQRQRDTQTSTKCLNNSSKLLRGRPSSVDKYQPETSYRSSLTNKSYETVRSLRNEPSAVIPALDEVAVQAVISILTGYIKNFLQHEDFRTSLRHNTFASINFVGLEEGLNTECKAIATLEQAIETVERATEGCASVKELKKASLQLSVITGLNSSDLRDGFTSGIPNFKLAACAQLYLSVIYKIQKKDGVAAKHLLQLFCDSPFQARIHLLPDLWDRLFLPHLSYLKAWYDSEANKSRKVTLVDKLYNEKLDKGTYQFALYYKEWITEGAEIPLLPCVSVSTNSSHLTSSFGGFSPQPVVSKKLYDEMFHRSHKQDAESEEQQEKYETPASSVDSTVC